MVDFLGMAREGWGQEGELCLEGARLGGTEFAAAMRQQLRLYAGRRLSDHLAHSCHEEADRAQARGGAGSACMRE